MQYRTMPKQKEKLSALGFGCMRLPTQFGGPVSSFIDKEKALEQIHYAIDNGVNYLDTAYPYHLGASESFLGDNILNTSYRDKVNIATKLPCMIINNKKSIPEIFDKQLRKLKVDQIDYYLLHSLDGNSWKKMLSLGIIEFMEKIKREEKIRYMGFSFHGKKEEFMTITDGYDWDFAQVQYNILDKHYQAGIEGIDYAHKKGMGVIVMEPLRGGSLVGKMPKEIDKLYKSAEVRRSPADWALRWVWDHPGVTLILSGMNNMDHIKENIKTAEDSLPGTMTEKENEIITNVRETYSNLLTVGCTGCAYCIPCPVGIDIPAAFKNLNNFHMFSKLEARVYHISYLGVQTGDGKPHWTSSCTSCGKCEKKCPQQLPIRSFFPQVRKKLEGPVSKTLAALARAMMRKKKQTKQEQSGSNKTQGNL